MMRCDLPPGNRLQYRWWIVFLALWMGVSVGHGREVLSLVVSDANPILSNTHNNGILDHLVMETFRRLGIAITITPLPSERALANTNAGIDDGDLLRIGGLEKNYPNLIQVREKWMDMEFSAFTRKPQVRIFSWQDLRPYAVGLIRGWKVFEKATEEHPQRSLVVNEESLLTLLRKDRVDLILYDRLQGGIAFKKMGMTDVREAGPPLTVEPLFLYLNKKHVALVATIEAVLREMKRDGSHARILNQATAATMQ